MKIGNIISWVINLFGGLWKAFLDAGYKPPVKTPVKTFDDLSPAEQRVRIAQDVIEQINLGKYWPMKGRGYIYGLTGILNEEEPIKENFESIQNCKVCGIGACLLSIVHFKNELIVSDVSDSNDFIGSNTKVVLLLSKYFPPIQIALIEGAFEGSYSEYYKARVAKSLGIDTLPKELEYKIREFYGERIDDNKRLIDIMQNIIDNQGEFKP